MMITDILRLNYGHKNQSIQDTLQKPWQKGRHAYN